MGVRGKIVFLLVGVAVIASGVLLFLAHQHRLQLLEHEVGLRGETIARQLGRSLGQLAVTLDSIHDNAAVKVAREESDVISAYSLDQDGMVVTDGTQRNNQAGRKLAGFDSYREEVSRSSEVISRREGTDVCIAGPILVNDEVYGFVHVRMSLVRANEQAMATLKSSMVELGWVMLIVFSISVLASYMFGRPVKLLVGGMKAIQDGNYKFRIPLEGNDEFGKLAGAINDVASSLRDATVAKRYLDEVLQSMVDSLIVVGTDANIVTVNRATMEMLNYQEKQLVGQPASLICIDEGYQLTGARLSHLLGDQTQQDHELQYRQSNGSLIPISFSGSPIRDNTGEVVGYVCIGKDITDRKRAEAEREELNRQLVDTSRQAGMAEVATGVLHNVGNVLNSVNMSASVIVDTVKRSKVQGLEMAVKMFSDNESNLDQFLTQDEKGKQLPGYLAKVTELLTSEQAQILGELNSLSKNIDHIKEIISMQQSYSKVTGVIESVDLAEILDEALRLNVTSLEHHGIKIDRVVEYVPAIQTDKHKVLQVLVNLITNARDAMENQDGDKTIRLRLGIDKEQDEMVRISVQDQGMGIPADNLTKIFNHGFTTKKKGHGFGLHSAALTAKEMGGSLNAYSDGPGTGATFTLMLPLKVGEVAS